MEIEFENTVSDFRKFYKSYFLKELTNRIIFVLIIPLVCAYFFTSRKHFSFTIFTLVFIISLIIILSLLYFIPLIRSTIKLKKNILKNDLLIQPTKMIITEAGLQIQKSGKISLFDWQTIDSVDSQKEFFHIRMVDKKFFLVPKSAFKGYSEELIFLATVKNNILKTKPANYNPSKQKPPYWLGIFCFIPVIGAFVGFVFIILGVTKFKDKWLQ